MMTLMFALRALVILTVLVIVAISLGGAGVVEFGLVGAGSLAGAWLWTYASGRR